MNSCDHVDRLYGSAGDNGSLIEKKVCMVCSLVRFGQELIALDTKTKIGVWVEQNKKRRMSYV